MFISTHKLTVFLLVYPLWLFATQGMETSVSHHTLNHHPDEAILNDDPPFSNIDDTKYCTVKPEGHIDCEESPINDQSIDALNQLYRDKILSYFLDIIFENSGRKCKPNDGCTRGYISTSYLGRNQSYHPVRRKCTGQKSIRNSSGNCAKHITGAIMTLINESLSIHCENESIVNYNQCVKYFNGDIKNNNISICQHGFTFPSAFCMLNLDGQSFHLYDAISDKNIQSKCKNGDRYNQLLLTLNVPLHDGGMMPIPLFKKYLPKKMKNFEKILEKSQKELLLLQSWIVRTAM